jgi:hypothetical protein
MATDPDDTRKGLINTFILVLKAAGVYAKLDAIHLIASHEGATGLLNIKSSSWPLATVNSPSFTTDRGYAGDGITASLTVSGYNPSVSSGKLFAQNDASAGACVNSHPTPTTPNSSPIIGADGADGRPRLIYLSAANQAAGRINGPGSNATATTNVSTTLGCRMFLSPVVGCAIDELSSRT